MLLAALLVSGCARHYTPEAVEDPYGFFWGIWHGLVFPLAVIANLLSWLASLIGVDFLEAIELIGRPNTGFWYYVGFAMGLLSAAGGSSQS